MTENKIIESDYKVTKELINEGWEYDEKRVYVPFPYTELQENEIFLSVTRKKSKKIQLKYMFCSKNDDGTFNNLAGFNRDKLINEEEIDSENKSSINQKISYAGINSGINVPKDSEAYKKFFRGIFTNIIRADCLEVLKNEDYTFQEEEMPNETEEDPYILEIKQAIEYRQNPKLNEVQKEMAQKVEIQIMENGFTGYLNPKLDKLHIGEHKNLYRKTLGAFNVMRGTGSYLFETTAEAEEGKSLEDDIVFLYLIPSEYIFQKNNMTEASFVRYSQVNQMFFTRLIILWGDLGSKNAFEKNEPIFNIIKILITEHKYSRDLSEKNSGGKYKNQSLDLQVESIGGSYSTIKNDFTDGDSQFESRTLSSTPFDADKNEIMDNIAYLRIGKSKQSKDKEKAIEELIGFKYYLLSLVNFDKEIINPYSSVFKRYVSKSRTQIREFQHLLELFDAYCVLTHHECNEINGELIASEEQVTSFFSKICLENVLIPYESNFITMLLGKDKKTEMTIIDDPVSEEEEENADEEQHDPLIPYFNTALEEMTLYENEEDVTDYTELRDYGQNAFIYKLLQLYRLRGSSSEHIENVFFRLSDLNRVYRSYRAYKNIDDVGKLLRTLHLKGYLGKLDFKDPKTNQNIYYVTSKCEKISVPIELDEADRVEATNFLERIGLGDADEV